ncbi:MAG: tetratricopeptide repeat protein [Deltaproteobacteria bacterium]|jgi:hypothetical protein|nr:tetratricopeptide repeat protein [Deltaproteobacteria bacterium]MBW2535188.1 tetratricopeptide repeat protein [Deltaproteobacteria bacterium]
MMRSLALALLLALSAVGVFVTPAAVAQSPSAISAADKKKAIGHYKRGRQLFAAKRYAPALEQFDASLALMPSPNTELLRAHALRELGRKAEAMTSYERVMNEATERIGLGQSRYQGALDDASQWFGKLRPDVAELRVLVANAPGPVTVACGDASLDAKPVDATGGAYRAQAWRAPGPVTVTIGWGEGEERTEQVELAAGKVETLEIDLAPPPEDTPPPEPEAPVVDQQVDEGDFPAPPLATWIAAGVGVVGFGLFAIFGSMSASTAADLDECAPQCPESLREDADSGHTQQTVANVGLVVGIAGIAAAGTIWLIDALVLSDDGAGDERPEDDAAVGLSVGPTGVMLHGTF